MAASNELKLLADLDAELLNLVEHFTALIKAARPPAEDEAGASARDRRPGGDLLGIHADKLLLSGAARPQRRAYERAGLS
jgi:hypothetical protein